MLDWLKVPTVLIDGLSVNAMALGAFLLLLVMAGFLVKAPGKGPKFVALLGSIMVGGLILIAMAEQLSRPKPLSMEWVQAQGEDGVAISTVTVQAPEWIYLTILIDGEPRLFRLVWTKKLQEALRRAMKGLDKIHGEGELKLRLNQPKGLPEGEFEFYPAPWPADPPKTPPSEEGIHYRGINRT